MPSPVTFSTVDALTPDGTADAYLARPDDGAAHPGVLLFMDAPGLRPRLREMVETIAARGYTVLAPNVFYRAGHAPVVELPDPTDPAARGKFMETLAPLMQALTPAKAMQDAGAYLDWLAGCEFVTEGPVALTGYCMGGRLALRTAGAYPQRVAATASFHGANLAVDKMPDSPHHAADRISAELYIAHADQDAAMPTDQIKRLEQALQAAGVRYTSEVYPGAPHGFTMSDSPAYNQQAEERHWRELFALLERTFPDIKT